MLNTDTARSVIDHALYMGADFAELFIEECQANTIATLSDQVQSVQSGIDFGIGLRIAYGPKVLYGFTNDTGREELKRIATDLAAKDR